MKVNVTIGIPGWIDFIFVWPVMVWRKWKYDYTFRRIYLGEGEWAKVSPKDYYWLSALKWSVTGKDGKYYAVRGVRTGPREIKLRSMQREIMNAPAGMLVDHRNGDALDYRRENLRLATPSQNSYNRQKTKTKTSSSKYRGVTYFARTGKWIARIKYQRKSRWLGYFDNEEEAGRAYDAAAKKYYGEFARLNFPENGRNALTTDVTAKKRSLWYNRPAESIEGEVDMKRRIILATVCFYLVLTAWLFSSEPNLPGVNEKIAQKCDHKHRAFSERVEEREEMVARQIKGRDINDANVLRAMKIVPRHYFVPADKQEYAYIDLPLPIGEGQTISQPYIVAFMTEALKLTPESKVLEIGTGSGYQAAICAETAEEVYTIEIIEGLAKSAKKRLEELGYKNVFVKCGDGYFGWPEAGPFDAIIGTAAAEKIPAPLLEQLKPAGRMILPYETEAGLQNLVLVTKDPNGAVHKKDVLPVRFVPMTGKVRQN